MTEYFFAGGKAHGQYIDIDNPQLLHTITEDEVDIPENTQPYDRNYILTDVDGTHVYAFHTLCHREIKGLVQRAKARGAIPNTYNPGNDTTQDIDITAELQE